MSKLGHLGRGVQEGSLYGLLFCLPFSIALIEVMFGLLVIGWVLERIDPSTRAQTLWRAPQLRWVALSLLAYLAVCLASVAVSYDAGKSFHGFMGKWFQYGLLFCIVTDVGARPGVAAHCLRALSWSALLVLIEAMSQGLLGKGLLRHYPLFTYGRITGPYQNPSDLGTYLMVVIPAIGTYASLQHKRLFRNCWYGMTALLVGCLTRTLTRGAWMGVGAGLCGLILLYSIGALWRYAAAWLGAMIPLAGVGLPWSGWSDVVFRSSDIGKVDRLFMWQSAIHMIKDRPILGHGVNTFMGKYLDYWVGGERMPRYAHNCYLQIAAETGLIGLVVFAVFVGQLFLRLGDALRRLRAEQRVILCGLVVGVIAFLVQAAVDTNFYAVRQRALFWVIAGLALGVAESYSKAELSTK